ncbi:sortase [Yimella sp. RIT 621]|uniref:SGNH/GDSL hydrolase family protein n=1 Tax=Yimella sp. RIT 621 TaxID=2510323 RepID=UPI00101C3925|nr:GDSL-type esterase/lipase family protein [Yimella sp. RIT 621]RYG77965.1 sortase [Yimella sp. RIT 621]
MKRSIALSAVLAVAGFTAAPAASAGADNPHASSGAYVALGDSLAAGYQPGLGDNKTGGYVGGVYANLRDKYRGAKLVNLACSGETSTGMIADGRCTYPDGQSQLEAAVDLIRFQKGKVRLITLNIGANDVQRCVKGGAVDMPCVQAGLTAVARNLPQITTAVRAAAGAQTQIVVLNYYNPFLAAWAAGNPQLAQLSTMLQGQLNASISYAAKAADAKVADVATAFRSTDWTPTASGVPTNVAAICALTWMCSKTDIHANDAGYALMASTVNPLVVGPIRPATASVG